MTRTLNVEIKSADEPWSLVTLTNGDKIKLRMICTGVRRVLDDKGEPAFAQDGKPEYQIDFQNVLAIQPKVTLDA